MESNCSDIPEVIDEHISSYFRKLAEQTPCYCYFEQRLEESAKTLLSYKTPFGLTVRYAMKANSNKTLLQLLTSYGFCIDASSANECYRALAADIPGSKISLTTQEVLTNEQLDDLIIKKRICYRASSLLQLENFGKAFPHNEIGLRLNIGIGSGSFKRTTTGGVLVSFGIYEQFEEIDNLLRKYDLKLTSIHVHIGSGANPILQKEAVKKILTIIKRFPDVVTVDTGGGFKVKRGKNDVQTSIEELSKDTFDQLNEFAKETGRKIKLEIEPGTYAVALSGFIVAKVIDIVTTGKDGHTFLKVNSGMTEAMRITLYGAQHPMYVIPMDNSLRSNKKYIVVGSCCETGDILTPKSGEPEEIDSRILTEAKVGDLLVIGASGAYCSSMSPANYNSHLKPAEYLVKKDSSIAMIRKKQQIEDLWKDEIGM